MFQWKRINGHKLAEWMLTMGGQFRGAGRYKIRTTFHGWTGKGLTGTPNSLQVVLYCH
jgi:hypothetical protein